MPIIITYDAGIDYGNVVGTSNALPGGVNTTYFYAAWTGWLVPSVTGLYTIGVNSQDGCNIRLCGVNMILNLEAIQSANSDGSYTQSFQTLLTAGVYYDIELNWQHGTGANYEFQLLWTPPAGALTVISGANLTSMSYTMTGNLWGQWANGEVGDGSGSGWFPPYASTGGSGSSTLESLSDVYVNPSVGESDKDVLSWVAADGKWENKPISSLPAASPVGSSVSVVTGGGGTLAANTTENDTLTMAKMFTAYKVTVNYPTRIRLYSTAAARTADASRPNSIPPTPGSQHGVIADLYLDESGKFTWICSPAIIGANADGSQITSIYAAITNLDSVSRAITVTIYFVAQES